MTLNRESLFLYSLANPPFVDRVAPMAFNLNRQRTHWRFSPSHKEALDHLPALAALDLHDLSREVHVFPNVEHEFIHAGTPRNRRLSERRGLASIRTDVGIYGTRGKAYSGWLIAPYV